MKTFSTALKIIRLSRDLTRSRESYRGESDKFELAVLIKAHRFKVLISEIRVTFRN